jgi:hypothetical protein
MSIWTEALDSAAAELGVDRSSWLAERMATLKVALQLQRSKWAAGNLSGSADLLALMNEIGAMRATAGLDVPREITVRVIDGLHAVCPRCGHHTAIDSEKLRGAIKVETPHDDSAPEPDAAHDRLNGSDGGSTGDEISVRTENPPVPVSAQRVGVSASRFHSQILNGHEVAPLKRPTGRLISPMSVPTPAKG